jgi:hypothetical protein
VPRTCTVCVHERRAAIDEALVAGDGFASIAREYAVSHDAVTRHRAAHLPAQIAQTPKAADVAAADDLLGQVRALRSKAMSILLAAERQGDLRTALSGIREARACLELLLEVEGEIDRRPTLNVLVAPEWLHTRAALLEALRPYPEARSTVAARLLALEQPA